MMDDRLILIPFGQAVLALTEAEFQKAVKFGREFISQHSGGPGTAGHEPERILDAEEASKVTKNVPASWFLEAARQGKIPHVRFGKYVRFRMSDLVKTLEVRG